MDINNYRNCVNNLITWEWNILKQLRKNKRRITLLRASFATFSLASVLFSVFAIPFIISDLIIAIGVPNSLVDITRIICFFIWLWFISPVDKLSKKEREEKNKKKVEVVKIVEKAIETYENKFK
tara:strand:+ start:333 stop:704 length:372 start_codon:yes stop_codon:yes gene_type:complete